MQSASRFFFRLDAWDLGPVESSILASLPSSPNRYSPMKDPRQAMERSRRVLQSMIKRGTLDRKEAARQYTVFWKNYLDDLKLRFPAASARDTARDRAPYFTEYVRQMLVKNYGAQRVYTGGLTVHTTLDLRQQAVAQKLVHETVQRQNAIAMRGNRAALRDLDMTIGRTEFRSG